VKERNDQGRFISFFDALMKIIRGGPFANARPVVQGSIAAGGHAWSCTTVSHEAPPPATKRSRTWLPDGGAAGSRASGTTHAGDASILLTDAGTVITKI